MKYYRLRWNVPQGRWDRSTTPEDSPDCPWPRCSSSDQLWCRCTCCEGSSNVCIRPLSAKYENAASYRYDVARVSCYLLVEVPRRVGILYGRHEQISLQPSDVHLFAGRFVVVPVSADHIRQHERIPDHIQMNQGRD